MWQRRRHRRSALLPARVSVTQSLRRNCHFIIHRNDARHHWPGTEATAPALCPYPRIRGDTDHYIVIEQQQRQAQGHSTRRNPHIRHTRCLKHVRHTHGTVPEFAYPVPLPRHWGSARTRRWHHALPGALAPLRENLERRAVKQCAMTASGRETGASLQTSWCGGLPSLAAERKSNLQRRAVPPVCHAGM